MRILIADDDSISRKLIESALKKEGHDVEAFVDGADLFERFKELPAPMVVTDWLMPKLTGIDLCRKIRAMPGLPYTHVAIVTTLSPGEHLRDAFAAGVDDFFSKPLDSEQFSVRIAAAGRAMFRHEEVALRSALERCQTALGPEHAALGDLLGELTRLYRRQRAFGRCRAFLRRHLATMAAAGDGEAVLRLREELADMDAEEEGA